jgi:hypothetical protein
MTRTRTRTRPFATDPPAPGGVAVGLLTPGDRARVSGPGLRGFRAIADLWGLSEQDRIRALGAVPRSTYHAWMRKAAAGGTVSLPLDTLLRISAILGIHKALGILFVRGDEATAWLNGPHQGLVFAGCAPRDLVVSGSPDAIRDVRRYLDAWRGGPAAPPDGAPIQPVTEDDVIFG